MDEAVKCCLMAEMKFVKPSKHLDHKLPQRNLANPMKQEPPQTVRPIIDSTRWTLPRWFSLAPSVASSWHVLGHGTLAMVYPCWGWSLSLFCYLL